MADRPLIQDNVRREVGEIYFPFIDRGDTPYDLDAVLERAKTLGIDIAGIEAERQRMIAEVKEYCQQRAESLLQRPDRD